MKKIFNWREALKKSNKKARKEGRLLRNKLQVGEALVILRPTMPKNN